jgi:hypothetical protein
LFKNVGHAQQLRECVNKVADTRNEMKIHKRKPDVRWSDDEKWHALQPKEAI